MKKGSGGYSGGRGGGRPSFGRGGFGKGGGGGFKGRGGGGGGGGGFGRNRGKGKWQKIENYNKFLCKDTFSDKNSLILLKRLKCR